jgi:TolB-like protein/Tfp pilus assembly protein PilF
VSDAPQDEAATSILDRLRRRKVVQWGIAYAAGAWGLLQGLAYVSGLLQWPEQLQKLVGLALLVGLPVALTLAWYHGDRGEQRVTRTELAILTLLFLVGGGLFWRYEHASRMRTAANGVQPAAPAPSTGAVAAPAQADSRPSIAVLPFENRSSRPDDAYFVDGIHDDILTQLSKLSGLKVISRTSVERFRDTKLPTSDIAAQLHVRNILEGGVQRAGDRVRINVQLIDAKSDAHLWADTYDRELTAANIFGIQSEVAGAIAGALKAALTPAERDRAKTVPTQNLEAWEAYQLGQQRLAKRNSAAFVEAEKYFRRAIALDPNFALAYSGLADTLALRLSISDAPVAQSLEQAQAAVDKALALDPGLSEAWSSAAIVAVYGASAYRDDLANVQAKLSRAIELDPNNAQALKNYGLTMWELLRIDEAQRYLEQAAELDPLSAIVQVNLAEVFQARGDFDRANRCYRQALEIDPTFSPAYLWLSVTSAYAQDRFADALTLIRKAIDLDADSVVAAVQQAELYRDLGDEAAFVDGARSVGQRWADDFRSVQLLAEVDLVEGRSGDAMARAERSLELYPRNDRLLAMLRDHDLRTGHSAQAVARYRKSYPELFAPDLQAVTLVNYGPAIDLAYLLRMRGDQERSDLLLDAAETALHVIPRLGTEGSGIADVQIRAIRGEKDEALAALRGAVQAGWRGPFWRYERDFDAALDSIRDAPEFKAAFAEIERDMARQRVPAAR